MSLAGIPRLSCPFCPVHVESGAHGADFKLLEVHVRAAHMQQGGQKTVTNTPEVAKFLNVARVPEVAKFTMAPHVLKPPHNMKAPHVANNPEVTMTENLAKTHNVPKKTPNVTRDPHVPNPNTPVVAPTPNARPDVACPHCDLFFPAVIKSNILLHLRDEHKAMRPVKCPFCGGGASDFESLWQHVNEAHGDEADTREGGGDSVLQKSLLKSITGEGAQVSSKSEAGLIYRTRPWGDLATKCLAVLPGLPG